MNHEVITISSDNSLNCLCPKCSTKFVADWEELTHQGGMYSGGVLISKECEDLISKNHVREAIDNAVLYDETKEVMRVKKRIYHYLGLAEDRE